MSSAFLEAVDTGDYSTIVECVKKGVDVNWTDKVRRKKSTKLRDDFVHD